jgi:hypothetical protein
MARKISVEIVGDSRSLERAFARSSRSAQRFQATVTGASRGARTAFAGVGAALGAVGVGLGLREAIQGLKATVNAASALNEQMNRNRVVFGRSAAAVADWAETADTAIGLSQAQALEAAASYGTMFQTLGVGQRQAVEMSKTMVTLAGDMASFNDQDPSEMLDKLRSGLSGEAEPLRRFGIFISEARTKTEAYRLGIARAGAELTEQQKVLARHSLIMRDSAVQQGDFANTADSVANVQRTVRGQIENLSAAIGQRLLPYVREYLIRLRTWLSDSENQQRVINTVEGAIRTFASVVRRLSEDWREFMAVVGGIRAVFGRIQDELERLRHGFKIIGLQLALDFVEPFSHLPSRFGKWARDAKEELTKELRGTKAAWHAVGRKSAEGYTEGFRAEIQDKITLRKLARERERRPPPPPPRPTVTERVRRGLTAAQRQQFFDARIARQLDRLQDLSLRKQLGRLREIAQAIRKRLAATQDITRRLTLEDKLLEVARQQRDVQAQINEKIQAGNQALKDRAEAIKSAVIERLQRRQTDILNRRALQDAREQLRIARQTGGKFGIREAIRGLQDVRFDILRARAEAAPATLTRGGRFALGGMVTININGVTDPDEVARRVTAILAKRRRRTTTQTRGPTAGQAGGPR